MSTAPTLSQHDLKAARRSELGDFLRARRAQVQPADVGLPAGGRRRTPGLRREEVALLAGVGITWYTWLEQGRPINASYQVLDAVARALRLSAADREHLYRLVDATPLPVPAAEADLAEHLHDVVDAFGGTPASLSNSMLDLLVTNRAYSDLFRDWHSTPCIHRNSLWCVVTEPTARQKLANYDESLRQLVGRFRAGYADHIGDPRWETTIQRLLALSDDFAKVWSRHEIVGPGTRLRAFNHPVAGRMTFHTVELAVPEHPDLRVHVDLPADERTRERMPLTRLPRAEPADAAASCGQSTSRS